jgi:hypothetical protein
VPWANTLWLRHEFRRGEGDRPSMLWSHRLPCMLSTAQGRTRYHQYVVGAETGCQAVTWNRNASDLFAGKWLRARDLNPRPDTERDAANG